MVALPEDDDEIGGEEQLALAGGDERLPWLESDDDYEQPGVDTGRIVAFAAVGLLALVLAVGALWWFTRDKRDEALVADGSVIEAPDQPYRTKPEDAGGRQVEGTGDTSFEVAEGKKVEGQIAENNPPAPSIDRTQASSGATPAPSAGAVGVQVGAYSTKEQAEAGWSQLSGRLTPLQGRSHRVVEGTVDGGKIFRLQALAGTVAEADTLCRAVKAAGGDCQVKR
jgi:hypothetical protein